MQRLCEDTHKGSPRETGRQAGRRYWKVRTAGSWSWSCVPRPAPVLSANSSSNTRGQLGRGQSAAASQVCKSQLHRVCVCVCHAARTSVSAAALYVFSTTERDHQGIEDSSSSTTNSKPDFLYILNVSCSSCLLPATTRRLPRPGGLPLPKKRRQHRSSDDVATVSCLRRRLAQTRALISQHSALASASARESPRTRGHSSLVG